MAGMHDAASSVLLPLFRVCHASAICALSTILPILLLCLSAASLLRAVLSLSTSSCGVAGWRANDLATDGQVWTGRAARGVQGGARPGTPDPASFYDPGALHPMTAFTCEYSLK
jgi:hypothetical protein